MADLFEEIHNLPVSSRDLASLVLGTKLGSGMSRDVYECRLDNAFVVKVENASQDFQNVIEWEIWNNVRYLPNVAKWFAPCQFISPNGIFLIQRRVEKGQARQYPKKVPYFFRDTKYDNFGFLDGRFVCCDYGTFLREDHFDTKRKKAVKWWDTR